MLVGYLGNNKLVVENQILELWRGIKFRDVDLVVFCVVLLGEVVGVNFFSRVLVDKRECFFENEFGNVMRVKQFD